MHFNIYNVFYSRFSTIKNYNNFYLLPSDGDTAITFVPLCSYNNITMKMAVIEAETCW
jgi:hypothetical protein